LEGDFYIRKKETIDTGEKEHKLKSIGKDAVDSLKYGGRKQ